MTPGQASPYGSQTAPAGPTGTRDGGISVQTLLIASVASAVSSFTVSKLWGPGTLFSAAATPIIVALVSELVRRPVRQVGATAQKVAPLRYRPPIRPHEAGTTGVDQRFPPPPPPGLPADTAIVGAESVPPDVSAPAADHPAGPRWRLVLTTGLLACLIVVGLFTALDVLAGQSITGNGDSSTYFGGKSTHRTTPPSTPTTPVVGPTGTSGTTSATTPAVVAPPPTATSGATGGTTGATGVSAAPNTAQPSATTPAVP